LQDEMSNSSSIGQRRHPDAECEKCPLFGTSARFCPSDGPRDADIVIVGEAPGAQEAKEGRPFRGPSGRLLDSVLEHHGLDRRKILLTNAVLCRPPSNKIGREEVKACSPRLLKELQEADPKYVVTLGNTATQVVLGTREGITGVRVGPPRRSDLVPNDSLVVPTFHPAAALRSADYFPYIVEDIAKLVRPVSIGWEPPVYRTVLDSDQAVDVLRTLQERVPEVVIDIETGSEKDDVEEWAGRRNIICVGFGYDKGRVIVLGERAMKEEKVQRALGQLLDSGIGVVAQNGKFDLSALSIWGEGNLVFDTMLASYACDERQGTHSLDHMSREFLGAPDWKGTMHPYLDKEHGYQYAPRGKLYQYNAFDVANTWDLTEYWRARMDSSERQVHDLLIQASPILGKAEMEGITIDLGYNDVLFNQAMETLNRLKDLLSAYGLGNPNSWQQVQEVLTALTGKPYGQSTNVDHLIKLRAKPGNSSDLNRFLDLMFEWRKEAKLYGTYIKGIRSRVFDDRIHATFLLHGTTTGRLASRNPNLQNIPRGARIRRQFVPAEGNLFVQADYASVELRVIAVEADDPYLRQLFAEGRDIHSEVAERFKGPGWTKEDRVRAKAVVYGLSYGREAFSLSQEYGMTPREAQDYLNAFFSMIPRTVDWKRRLWEKVQSGEDLETHFGRRRRRYLLTDENVKDIEKESYAFIPQSTASDICLSAAIRLRRDYGLHVIIPVHDSLLVEASGEEATNVGRTMAVVMEQTAKEVYSDKVPFPVEVKIGKNWGEV
jgi:uracil-DNA glycosylase family 4